MFYNEIMASASAATSANSVPVQLDDLTILAIQVTFTGSNVVGTLKLQASNYPGDGTGIGPSAAAEWIDVEDSSQAVTASSSHMWNIDGAGFRWVRAVWTYTSGTGNISMNSIVKQPYNRF